MKKKKKIFKIFKRVTVPLVKYVGGPILQIIVIFVEVSRSGPQGECDR